MSFLDGVLGKIAEEHGIDADKLDSIKEMVGKMDVSEVAKKAGIPEEAVEKLSKLLDK